MGLKAYQPIFPRLSPLRLIHQDCTPTFGCDDNSIYFMKLSGRVVASSTHRMICVFCCCYFPLLLRNPTVVSKLGGCKNRDEQTHSGCNEITRFTGPAQQAARISLSLGVILSLHFL